MSNARPWERQWTGITDVYRSEAYSNSSKSSFRASFTRDDNGRGHVAVSEVRSPRSAWIKHSLKVHFS